MAITVNRSFLPLGPQPLPSKMVASFRRTDSEAGSNISLSEHRQLIALGNYWRKNRLFEKLLPREAEQEMALLNEIKDQQNLPTRTLLATEEIRDNNAVAAGTVNWEAVGPLAALAVALTALTLIFGDEIYNLLSPAQPKEDEQEEIDDPYQHPKEEGLRPLGSE